RPGWETTPASTSSNFKIGIPYASPSNFWFSMASSILVNECTVRSADNLPFPMIYSPVGSISTPWGDLGVGKKYTAPGTLVGSTISTSSTQVVVAVWVFSSYTLCAYLVGVFVPP